MNNLEAIKQRHSVRSYTEKPIGKMKIATLEKIINRINLNDDLSFKLVTEEPTAFSGIIGTRFDNVKNYIVLAGKNSKKLDERIGYYGEMLVIEAQKLGLNTCWVALTYSKSIAKKYVDDGFKLVCVLSLGFGETAGSERKSKKFEEVVEYRDTEYPDWFKAGIESALLAPTAMNQQRFMFSLENENEVSVRSTGGFYADVDLGIVKYHFEIGAGQENFVWKE